MHVVQLLPELNEGGVERGVVELNRELVRRGVASSVVSAGGRLAGLIERDGGRHLTFALASKNPLTLASRVRGLRKLLASLDADLLHARSRVPAWLGWLANRRLGLPFVTTVHGFNSVSPYSRVMTFGRPTICVSGAIRDYVLRHYPVCEADLRVIPRGVDLVHFSPERVDAVFRQRFVAEFNLADRVVVATVGRITQLKDYETFLRAIDLVRKREPAVMGLVVGGVREDKRAYFAGLQQLVRELQLEDHVRFTGSRSEVADIYALSRVIVSSSKKPESFGRSAAEALAMGVPVVASGHGGILDIVIPGTTGFLFAPGDAAALAEGILAAVGRPWEGLRDFVLNNFSLELMVEKTLAVYREATATRVSGKGGAE